MSYEGYDQYICGNGHFFVRDCYDSDINCPSESCDSKAVWTCAVDQTNGCDFSHSEEENHKCSSCKDIVTPEVLEPAKVETCDHCGHSKTVEAVRYKIPENKGQKIDPDANRFPWE